MSMANKAQRRPPSGTMSRRQVVSGTTLGAAAVSFIPRIGLAQRVEVAPPSTITTPPRDFGPNGAPTTYFTDPDVISVDPLFNQYAQPNSAITRLWTGSLWG